MSQPNDDRPLPCCQRCGARGMHNLVLLGNDERWYLCVEPCFPLFVKAARDWLRQQKRS